MAYETLVARFQGWALKRVSAGTWVLLAITWDGDGAPSLCLDGNHVATSDVLGAD